MESRKGVTRITLDLPTETHKKLKILAATHEKSMRIVIMESLEKHLNKLEKLTNNQQTVNANKKIEKLLTQIKPS